MNLPASRTAGAASTLTCLRQSLSLRHSLLRGRPGAAGTAGTASTDGPVGPAALEGTSRGAHAPDGTPDPHGEAGMATAEYAIGTVAAAAFAGVLMSVLKSGSVKGVLVGLIEAALSLG